MDVLLMHASRKERENIRELLVRKGFSVSESTGGLRMLEDVSQFKKDLVVLDYDTWRANRGVYRYFGVERAWTGVPVVVISASKKADIFSERHPHEKDAFVTKPLDTNEFDQVLGSFTNQ